MMMSGNKKLIGSILLIILVAGIFYLFIRNGHYKEQNPKEIDYEIYESNNFGPYFIYPKSWGKVTILEGNKVCPSEDTYRTPDTLQIYDQEYSFPELKLPASESFVRLGVRTYLLDPKHLNKCGDEFHLKIATGEIDPRIFSSYISTPITNSFGLYGTYTPQASRLNTEARTQYTFFVKQDAKYYLVQTYFSFVPVAGSKELAELEQNYKGDMHQYIKEGKTAEYIRKNLAEFDKMSDLLMVGE